MWLVSPRPGTVVGDVRSPAMPTLLEVCHNMCLCVYMPCLVALWSDSPSMKVHAGLNILLQAYGLYMVVYVDYSAVEATTSVVGNASRQKYVAHCE